MVLLKRAILIRGPWILPEQLKSSLFVKIFQMQSFLLHFKHAVRNMVLDFASRRPEPIIPDFTNEMKQIQAISMPQCMPQPNFLLICFLSFFLCTLQKEMAVADMGPEIVVCLLKNARCRAFGFISNMP